MIYPILGLTWLVLALYLIIARESLEATGVWQPWLLVLGAGLLAAYDFFRWAMSRRARRPSDASGPVRQEQDETPRPVVNPEFDFSDSPDKKR